MTYRETFDPLRCGITLACTLRRLYWDKWEIDKSMRLLCNQQILDALKSGQQPDEILRTIAADVNEFKARSAGFLLY